MLINTQYIRYAGKVTTPMAGEANVPAVKTHEANEPNKVAPAPKKIPVEVVMLRKYHELAKQVDIELQNP